MKLIAIFMVLLMVGIVGVSAHPLDKHNLGKFPLQKSKVNEVGQDPINIYKTGSSSSSSGTTFSEYGGGIFTAWVWNGQECVKANLLGIKTLAKKELPLRSNQVSLGDYHLPEYEWRARIISGDSFPTRDLETGRNTREKTCNPNIVGAGLLPFNWYHQQLKANQKSI
jgi:hypothetical protein